MGAPRFDHLLHLTTATGLWEHALLTAPRTEHGMCVDDVARALVVVVRTPDPSPALLALARTSLAFLLDAQGEDGRMHNRRHADGRWLDAQSDGDHWGRALWAFGTAVAHSPDAAVVAGARLGAARAVRARCEHPRAMAYAALGAVELLRRAPDDAAAHRVLHDARLALPLSAGPGARWPWPYERLTYANAVLPEAMIAIGAALHDGDLRHAGLVLLGWLEDEQTVDGHLSVVPAAGRAPGDPRPAFDQQPIEVVALAEAARTAWSATRDRRWRDLLARCVAWFEGDNDARVPLRDAATGGCCDGLERRSVNRNQGAESTLAWLATEQLALALDRELGPVGRR
ncbi:glycosyltransferase [Actinotalea solisilvae]|uniref:glycosyltransferase n=1 Tax=Actinotalea solisilvae TaxID=2072922 RepID=UPI0018F24ABA|nr:glycosyltransferase [Actinotalea solisilvae]